MSVKTEVNGDVMIAYLSGELDHHSAKQIREEIDAAIEANMPTLLVLDFKDITFMDSSGIGLVMGRYKVLSQNGAELSITNPSPQIYKVMQLAGLGRLAKIEKGGLKNETVK
ncbi:MAG: anti-sigma factor antagonist [Clostridia bacterium]|nr:anti-sigma factor antagonist [Clostridia bacterium]MBR3593479.1 anti-sigma factor antagonist [Clostridia bacterium]